MLFFTFSPLILLLAFLSSSLSAPTSSSDEIARSKLLSSQVTTSDPNIRTLPPQQSTIIRLSTPSLPLWNHLKKLGVSIPTSLLINLTLSHCHSILLLNGHPIYPFASSPPLLTAKQTDWSPHLFASSPEDVLEQMLAEAQYFGLDYKQAVSTVEDGYVNLEIDIIGAHVGGYSNGLLSLDQEVLHITLHPDPEISHRVSVTSISLSKRKQDFMQSLQDRGDCTSRSWDCSDLDEAPWYRWVNRREWDFYGRIGSAKWEMSRRMDMVERTFGTWRVLIGLLMLASLVGSTPAICVGTVLGKWFWSREIRRRYVANEEDVRIPAWCVKEAVLVIEKV